MSGKLMKLKYIILIKNMFLINAKRKKIGQN